MQPDSTASSRRIARQILDLISEARFDPGHHLREQHLADALGVSRTPVRAGLKELTRMGAVEARPNQGFFLLKRSNELDQLEIEQSKSNDQKLYEQSDELHAQSYMSSNFMLFNASIRLTK